MNDIFEKYRQEIILMLQEMVKEGALPDFSDAAIALEPPRDPTHGEMALNAAMALAKSASQKPRALAEAMRPRLLSLEGVLDVQIAGAGFLNLRLKPQIWQDHIAVILKQGASYGSSSQGAQKAVSIEYVSANPTGPLHIGHARGAVFGDSLARLMRKTGYKITCEYYVNDEGAQIDMLADSVYWRIRESLGERITMGEGLYPGAYLIPVAEEILKNHGKAILSMPEKDRRRLLKQESVRAMMAIIKEDLEAMDAHHDLFLHESDLMKKGAVEAAVAALEKKGFIYEGSLPPPKGKRPEDWEPHPQRLFRATAFGDDADRPLQKKNGAWTYFASDIAYHNDKKARGFDEMIDVWGADHGGYVERMAAALEALGSSATFTVKLCHMVRVLRDSRPVKMSKREGGFVALRDVLEEIGKDAFRFQMLTRKNDAPLDFDLARLLEEANDNPVFYVQYAHARICSVMRNKEQESSGRTPARAPDLSLLKDEAEMALVKMLARFPRHVALAAAMREPHRIAFYLHDLSALFHALWNKGKSDPSLRFLHEDSALTEARLALLRATQIVLAEALRLMGVAAKEEMR